MIDRTDEIRAAAVVFGLHKPAVEINAFCDGYRAALSSHSLDAEMRLLDDIIADLDMRARSAGDVEDGAAVLDLSCGLLARYYALKSPPADRVADSGRTIAPQSPSDAQDAARYRWLQNRFAGYDFQWSEPSMVVAVFEVGANFRGSRDISAAIDAAMLAAPAPAANEKYVDKFDDAPDIDDPAAFWAKKESALAQAATEREMQRLVKARPLSNPLSDYWIAISGEGPLAFQWQDKPHRLVYDLVAALLCAPQSPSDAQDAARYRWLQDRFAGYDFEWSEPSMAVAVFEVGANFRGSRDISAAIDAAMLAAPAQQVDHTEDKLEMVEPAQAALPSFIARQADRALDDAIHPKGMHTNGKAIVQMEASQFAILLKYAKGIAIAAQQEEK